MKKFVSIFTFCVLLFALTACTNNRTPENIAGFTREDFAKIDGSTVTIPLTEAWAENILNIENGSDVITHNKTSVAIQNLIDNKAEIIFTTYPSEKEFADARASGVEFEITPVVNDAFVFLVNENNNIDSLTQEQIRQIYSGNVTNWGKFGGDDVNILAFQRPEGSGSQSGMVRFMGDTKLAAAPTQDFYLGEMSDMVSTIVAPNNGAASIGYSYYYYVNAMYIKQGIKLLGVDGVAPTNENIKNRTYPIVTPYYAIIRKDSSEDSFARKFLEYALSSDGQSIANQAGYVEVK